MVASVLVIGDSKAFILLLVYLVGWWLNGINNRVCVKKTKNLSRCIECNCCFVIFNLLKNEISQRWEAPSHHFGASRKLRDELRKKLILVSPKLLIWCIKNEKHRLLGRCCIGSDLLWYYFTRVTVGIFISLDFFTTILFNTCSL